MFRYYFVFLALFVTLITLNFSNIVHAKTQTLLYPIDNISSAILIDDYGNNDFVPVWGNQNKFFNSPVKLAAINSGFRYPFSNKYQVSSPFGWRKHPITRKSRFHHGIDFAAPHGARVLAARSGVVEFAETNGGYGKTVILKHNNPQENTLYAHLSNIKVQRGQRVESGTVVGLVGSTGFSIGPHLHFELRQPTSEGWKSIDPSTRLRQRLSPSKGPAPSEDIPDCDRSFWGTCIAPPPCRIALFGDCK
jgi:murein DD-endopeptidase MepM/ murein hydrolase activator NlpD